MTQDSEAIGIGKFWHLIGCRPVSAAVVAAQGRAGRAGFLGLSASHLSADPPIMTVAIGHRTSALEAVIEAGHFSINYLPAGTEAIAESFGGKSSEKGNERFADGWTTLKTGAPIYSAAIVAFDCTLEETIERFNTVIALGRVVAYATNETAKPLQYFRGGYE